MEFLSIRRTQIDVKKQKMTCIDYVDDACSSTVHVN